MKFSISHIKYWSLTARLLFLFATISLIAWLVATAFTISTSAGYIKTFFDNQQILMAKTLLNMDSVPNFKDLPPTETFITKHGELKREDDEVLGFALFSAQGEVLLTDGQDGKDFPFLPHEKGFSKVEVDGDKWRILWMHSADGTRIAAVGQEKEYRDNLILDILWGQISPWLIILPCLLLGFGFVLFKELRPLRKIAKHLNAREAHDTSPILHDKLPPEIQPLVTALNTLFKRIGILLAHERAFVANAAHELRTPLAGLKIQAEVLAMSEGDTQGQKHALEKIMQATSKCSHLIDQLLLLSQLENKFSSQAGQVEGESSFEAINFEHIIIDVCQDSMDFATSKNITLNYVIHSNPAYQKGIATLWAIALRNLVDNAIRHTKPNNTVQISLFAKSICVENTETYIESDVLPQLGKRFYRPAGQDANGSGLGLAIVSHIAGLHGATFSIENNSTNNSVLACINLNCNY